MAGFKNDVAYGSNGDFSGTFPVGQTANILATDGQLWIGSTALNAGSTHINVGKIVAGNAGITIGYSSPNITVSLTGGGVAVEHLTGTTGGQLNPDGSNNFNLLAGVVAAGTIPVQINGLGSTLTTNIQTSQAIAAADATKIGLSNFDSTSFAVAATGFVTLSTTGAGKTITGDSGGALSPTANNWNILGLSGSKTSGSGSTLTIKSPPFSQVGASATSSLNTGEFVTAAVTRTLPVSAGLADGDLFIYVCTTAGALVIQSVDSQKIRIGTLLSSAAGTATSTAIGDSVTLRFDATQGFFMAVSVIGTWLIA